MSEPRIFLYGYYGCANLGDELLLSAVASGILKRWPNARFLVRNMGPVSPEPRLRDRIATTEIERHLNVEGRSRLLRVASYLGAANAAFKGCRCLVLGGGTLLHRETSLGALVLLAMLVLMARARGLAVIGMGLGAAHLDRFPSRPLARFIVALMNDVALRDEASLAALHRPAKARLTADLVYSWWPRERVRTTRPPGNDIAVTLWSMPPADETRLADALAAALAVEAAKGSRIRFLVFQHADKASGGFSDIPSIEKIRAGLLARGFESDVVCPTTELGDLDKAFAGAAVHVGARFHACIIAGLLGIPSVGLATDPKITSLCQTFSMPWLTTSEMTATALAGAIAKARAASIAAPVIESLRANSDANFAWFDAHRAQTADAAASATSAGVVQ